MDWKDTLSQLQFDPTPTVETPAKMPPQSMSSHYDLQSPTPVQSLPPLTLFYEKRHGKPSTIIAGYANLYDERRDEVRDLASTLKKRLSCGGSERDGEILLQGDVRQRLRPLLQSLGYKVKG